MDQRVPNSPCRPIFLPGISRRKAAGLAARIKIGSVHVMNLRRFLVLLAFACIPALCCANDTAKEQTFEVTGVIKARLDDGALVIQHEEIPGYMAAMTMRFTPADPREAAALQPGDRVRFRYRVSDDSDVVDRFVVIGKETPKPAAASAARPRRVKAGDPVPEFSLIDEAGQPLTTASLRDHYTIVTFIFTRCPVPEFCPAMALKFASLQKKIAADPALTGRVRLLSVTLDPEFDRPEILTAYGRAVGANPAIWNFATGEKAAIENLSRAFAVFTERNGVTLDHTLCTALIGPDGRVVELWRGGAWKIEELLGAIPPR